MSSQLRLQSSNRHVSQLGLYRAHPITFTLLPGIVIKRESLDAWRMVSVKRSRAVAILPALDNSV